jgi:hypothetical protein
MINHRQLERGKRNQGIHPVTAFFYSGEGKLPVLARRLGNLILGDAPTWEPTGQAAVEDIRAMTRRRGDGGGLQKGQELGSISGGRPRERVG